MKVTLIPLPNLSSRVWRKLCKVNDPLLPVDHICCIEIISLPLPSLDKASSQQIFNEVVAKCLEVSKQYLVACPYIMLRVEEPESWIERFRRRLKLSLDIHLMLGEPK